jgi:tight adherence protein C
MLLISFLLTISLIFLFIILRIFEPKLKFKKRVNVFMNGQANIDKDTEDVKVPLKERIGFIKKLAANLRGKTEGYFSDKISSKKEEDIEKKLLQAGSPFGMTVIDFHVYKIALTILLPVIFGLYGKLLGSGFGGIAIFASVGLAAAQFVPSYYINSKINARYKMALRELPDFLDLLTVSLEAGLGFDLALNKVISKRNGILSSEFHISLEEMRLGKTRREALTGVKERLGFDELKSLINSLLQAEKLGISMVQIFRIKSQEEREKRRQRAEEEAMKAPIKILFPLILFIFPSLFIVILGPIVIQFMAVFSAK